MYTIEWTASVNMVAPTDYLTRFNTTIAGGSLPDLMFLGVIPNAAEFLQSQCADLTPYLSGDAIKEFPNLANFSAYTWRSGIVEGRIYAIPSARPPIGSVAMYHPDLFEAAGMPIPHGDVRVVWKARIS